MEASESTKETESDGKCNFDTVQHVTEETTFLTAIDSATDAQRQSEEESGDVEMSETVDDQADKSGADSRQQLMSPDNIKELPVLEVGHLMFLHFFFTIIPISLMNKNLDYESSYCC